MIYLIIYVSDNCSASKKVVAAAKEVTNNLNFVNVRVKNLAELNGKIIISPAVFLNNELFCYGEIDQQNLLKRLESIFRI
jgi:predicted thioredoxin/glutaredoxin